MRMRWLARLLAPRLKRWAAQRKPDFRVTDKSGAVYLNRWHIVKPRWWRPGLYLHQMLRDDDAVLHDHPYASVSLVLAEGLREQYTDRPEEDRATERMVVSMLNERVHYGSEMMVKLRYPQPGDIVYRSSRTAHQLQVLPGSDPWTLFFTGRRLMKEWGFWCPKGWRHFRRYADVQKGISGEGLGCGEAEA